MMIAEISEIYFAYSSRPVWNRFQKKEGALGIIEFYGFTFLRDNLRTEPDIANRHFAILAMIFTQYQG